MNPIICFLDVAFLTTNNIEDYINDNLCNKLAQFQNNIKEIEDCLLFEGDHEKIINIPIKNDFLYQCLMYPPSLESLDPLLTNSFYRTFNIIRGKYMIECDMEFENNFEKIYENNQIPPEINNSFNNFLDGCVKNREDSCICRSILKKNPIFITEKSILKNENNFIIIDNADDIKINLPFLSIYPSINDDINIKARKLRFLIEICLLRKGMDVLQSIDSNNGIEENIDPLEIKVKIMDEFWDSDLFFIEDENMRLEIIEIMSDLLFNPSSLSNRLHRLEHEFIKIDNKKWNLDQIDIFQEYKIHGSIIYPRLLFRWLRNKLYFYKIINRH